MRSRELDIALLEEMHVELDLTRQAGGRKGEIESVRRAPSSGPVKVKMSDLITNADSLRAYQ
jgi:hypothetical protein